MRSSTMSAQQKSEQQMDFNDWQQVDDRLIRQLPYRLAEWLTEFGSLTEKLSRYVDKVQLQVLRESALAPSAEEAAILQLDSQAACQVREVVLFGPDAPWIFARTSMPTSSKYLVERLGDKPLGSILFSDEELRRQFLQIRKLDSGDPLYQSACHYLEQSGIELAKVPALWARRSLWKKQQNSDAMLVCEVFLPAAPLYQ